jgi:PEP-CTERM motif
MRSILGIVLALLASAEANASVVYTLPAQGTFTVDGPFLTVPDLPFPPFGIFVPTYVSVIGGLPIINAPPGEYYGFSAFIGVSSGLTSLGYAYCGGNQGGGPCSAYTEANFSPSPQNATLNISADYRVINIRNDIFGGSTFPIFNFPSLNDFSVLLTLPDGFSIEAFAPAVPEPSTWTMLLIGFVGISVTRYRRRKSAMLHLISP